MKRLMIVLMGVVTLGFATTSFGSVSFQFTADDVVSAMASQGAPLSNGSNQWGLWAVRAMPTGISGGGYTITNGTTTQTGWGVSAPNGAFGAAPYSASNSAWFYDYGGSEIPGNPANPLYMIMDKLANTFTSFTFDASGNNVGSVPPDLIVPPGVGGGGTNLVTKVSANSFFDVIFDLTPGATWDGTWQFVVDGSKYTSGTDIHPGEWVEDFFGGYTLDGGTPGGGLANNMGAGYQVTPEPTTIVIWSLLGGLAICVGWWRKRIAT